MLFAELPSPDSYQAIGWLAVALGSLFVCINQAMKFFDRFKEHPPVHQIYATKVDHANLESRFGDLDRKVDDNYKTLDQKRSVSVGNLHEALGLQTKELNKRIDEVPQRTIQLLLDAREVTRK